MRYFCNAGGKNMILGVIFSYVFNKYCLGCKYPRLASCLHYKIIHVNKPWGRDVSVKGMLQRINSIRPCGYSWLSLSADLRAPASLPLCFLPEAGLLSAPWTATCLVELCCHGDVLSVRLSSRCALKQPVISYSDMPPSTSQCSIRSLQTSDENSL